MSKDEEKPNTTMDNYDRWIQTASGIVVTKVAPGAKEVAEQLAEKEKKSK